MSRRIYVWLIPKGITLYIQPISNQWIDICQHNIPTTSPLTNVEAIKEIKEKEMTQNLKIRIVPLVVLLVYTLKILQKMKTPPPLAEELA